MRTGFITGLNRRLDDPTRESRALVSRRDVSPSASAASLGSFFVSVSVSRPLSLPGSDYLPSLLLSTRLSCHLPPLASDPPLSLVYGLLFANSAATIDASRLIANPSSVYPPYLFPLTRAVNEIHAEDINRHSLRSRWVSRRPETRVRKYVLRDAVGQERAVFSN